MIIELQGGPNHGETLEVPDGMDTFLVPEPIQRSYLDEQTEPRPRLAHGTYTRDSIAAEVLAQGFDRPWPFTWRGWAGE